MILFFRCHHISHPEYNPQGHFVHEIQRISRGLYSRNYSTCSCWGLSESRHLEEFRAWGIKIARWCAHHARWSFSCLSYVLRRNKTMYYWYMYPYIHVVLHVCTCTYTCFDMFTYTMYWYWMFISCTTKVLVYGTETHTGTFTYLVHL